MLTVIPRVITKKIKNTVNDTKELKWYPRKYLFFFENIYLIQKAVMETRETKRHTTYRK